MEQPTPAPIKERRYFAAAVSDYSIDDNGVQPIIKTSITNNDPSSSSTTTTTNNNNNALDDDTDTATTTATAAAAANPKSIDQKRLHVDLGDYLQYFRTNSIEVPTETLSYYQVLPLWMNLDSNIDNLCVGSSLQRTDVSNGFYPFIKSLYAEAKRCLLGQRRDGADGDGDGDVEFGEVGEVEEDGDFRMAKVLVLTAGLFEQCRISEVRNISLFFGKSADTSPFDTMKNILPFMHVAQCNTSSCQTLKCFLQSINWKQKVAEIMRKQPVLRINFKVGRDGESRRITLNPLITFQHLIATYAPGVFNDDGDDDGDNGTRTKDENGNVRYVDEHNALRGAKYESIRMAIHRNEKLMAVTYLPYARQRSLSLIGIEKDDTLIVQNIESDSTTNGEAIDKYLLPTTNGCFDPSLKHWMPVTFNLLHERTKSILPDDDGHTASSLLFRAVIQFWGERGTGRIKFMSADTQMVCSFSTFTYNVDDPNGISYIRTCYENARHYVEGRDGDDGDDGDGDNNKERRFHNTAKTYLLTAGLMEQGQFTPIDELLDCYSAHDSDEEMIVDEEAMKEKHPWLHDAYVATKSRGALTRYLTNLNVEAQKVKVRTASLSISLRFFHVQSKNFHRITVNPLVSLETLLGIHTNVSKFSYRSIRIGTDDNGRVVFFSESRRKSLAQLGIKNRSILILEDVEDLDRRPPIPENALLGSSPYTGDIIMAEFMDAIMHIVKHHVKKKMEKMKTDVRMQLGEAGSMLFVISRYFLKPINLMKTISADEMDKFQGVAPYDSLYRRATELMEEGAFFEAKATVLAAAFVEQCQVTGVYESVACFSSEEYLCPTSTLREKLENTLPICYDRCAVVEDADVLMNYLQKLDMYKHCNELRGKEPRINMVYSNRVDGIDQPGMINVNSHITFQHFVKKYSVQKKGNSLQSLRIARNGFVVFISSSGKKTLHQLGMKDDDILVFEDQANKRSSTRNITNNSNKKGKSNSKKNKKKIRAMQKNKPREPREQITVPQTEEQLRHEHSKSMSPVLEQLEREKLRKIRLKLNNLSIKKTEAKERRQPIATTNIDSKPVFNPPTEGLEGKAGRVVYPVIVGNSEHLYKSSKKSAKSLRCQIIRDFDLHGCTVDDGIAKLNAELSAWTDAAMKEESFTIPVDIVCGGGNQILSEVVEQWIRKNRQVANRPKGFI